MTPLGRFHAATSFRAINHVYCGLGWAVLEPNVRGSSSYGDALLRGNVKDITIDVLDTGGKKKG